MTLTSYCCLTNCIVCLFTLLSAGLSSLGYELCELLPPGFLPMYMPSAQNKACNIGGIR